LLGRVSRIAAIAFLYPLAFAQGPRASIAGHVTDSTDAAVPGAVVHATRIGSTQFAQTRTDQAGNYSLVDLAPGEYSVEVTADGFKSLKKDRLTLQGDDRLTLALVLELGNVSEHVSVSAEAEKLQTQTASRSYRWEPAKVKSLPLIGRQAYTLIGLTPGVIFTQEQFGTTGFVNLRGFDTNTRFVINGGREGTNQFLLNGAPISLLGSWQYTPSIDAIDEFKVLTNTYDAQFGRTGGGAPS
jgi:Carboxypeptidase regulatory-like domain/TonB-dependent Receptor Plug Domain